MYKSLLVKQRRFISLIFELCKLMKTPPTIPTFLLIFSFLILISCDSKKPQSIKDSQIPDSSKVTNPTTDSVQFDNSTNETEESERPEITKEIVPFIPKGFLILYRFDEDMNLDSTKDVVLILEIDTTLGKTKLNTIFGSDDLYQLIPHRPFIILTRQKNGTLKLAARNDELYRGVYPGLWGDVYFAEPEVSKGRFGYSGFYLHGGQGHSESDILFEYSKDQNDWLLIEYGFSYTSDIPTKDGGYDDHEGSYFRTQKDFGIIGINKYEGVPQ